MTEKEYLEKVREWVNTGMEDENLAAELNKHNEELVVEFPFLRVYGQESCHGVTSTMLDDMPQGWRIAFGRKLCEELKEELVKNNALDSYEVEQIKEKFGGLRWYDNCHLPGVQVIIAKYEVLSEKTCIVCGKPAKWMSKGWISPYCDDCATYQSNVLGKDINKSFNKIEEE